jgi:hypothetical protein
MPPISKPTPPNVRTLAATSLALQDFSRATVEELRKCPLGITRETWSERPV